MIRFRVATLLATVCLLAWVKAELPAPANGSWAGTADTCAELIARAAISRRFGLDNSTDAAAPVAALRVLLPDAFSGWLTPALERFSAAHGTSLELDVRPISQLPAIVGAAARRPGQAPEHDVYLHTADLTLTLADAGLLTDLSTLLEVLDGGVEWMGVSQNFRLQVATYLGSILAMPLDGTSLVAMYRVSTFAELGLQAPQTWRELLAFIRTYTAAAERYRLSGRAGRLPPHALCLPLGMSCRHQSYLQAIWSTIAQTHGVTQGVHFDTATLTPLIDSVAGLEAFRIFAELKTAAAPEEPDEPCSRGSLSFARGRCALTLGSYGPQIRILLDGGANSSVAQSDVGISRLPGSDVVWARGGKQNGGTGGSGGGELKPCDASLCPYSALADVLPAPVDGGGSSGIGIGAWHAQASLVGGSDRQPRLVNYSPQSPTSLLMGAVNKRSDVLAQLLGYQLLLYLASPSRYLDTLADGDGGNSSSMAAASPLRVVEPVRPALLSASSSPVWRAAGHAGELVERALPVLAEANQHLNHAWGLRMVNGAYYLEMIQDIIEGIDQGLVMPEDMVAATADELEVRTNSSEAWHAAAGAEGVVQQRREGRALVQVSEFTSAAKPVGLQAALSRAAALAAAYYPPAAYRNNYLASLASHSTDHAHTTDSAGSSQSGGGGTSTGVVVGAVLGTIGGVALLLSLLVALVVFGIRGGGVHAALHRRLPWLMMALGLRRRRFKPHNYEISEHAQVKAPGISSRSALLVTDIEDSTRLWEEVAADVMSRALQLHHACIRHLIVEHHGYESATEGDSFIIAFVTVKHAVAFATELQTQLLVQPWPQELLTDKICMPVYTDLPEGFPFTHHEPEEIAAVMPRGVAGAVPGEEAEADTGDFAGLPFASASGAARSALINEGRRRRRVGRSADAVDVMDLTYSAARLDGFTRTGYNNSGPPTPTAMSMSAAAQIVGRPQPSLAALEHICSMRRSQEGRRRSSVAGGGRSMSAALLPGRLHFRRSSGASGTPQEGGGRSGSACTGTPRSKAAAILASAAATARAAANAAAGRMGWRGSSRGDSTGALLRLHTPLGRGSVPAGVERSAASRAAIAAPAPASGDLHDGEEVDGAEEAGSAPFWGTHERSTTACVLQRERDSCMQLRRPPQLLIPTSVGGEEEFSSCSWFSSSGRGSGSDGESGGGGGGTAGGESCDRSDLPDGATISALTSGNYEILSEPLSPERYHDPAHAGREHARRAGHQGAEKGEALEPGADEHQHQQQRRRRHRHSRHSNGSQDDHGHDHGPRDRNSVTAALPPVLPWLPSGNQGYAADADDAVLTEVTADNLIGINGTAQTLASFVAKTAAATADEDDAESLCHSDENEDLLLSVTAALPAGQHGRSSLRCAAAATPPEDSDGASVQLEPQLLSVTGSLALAPRPSHLRLSATGTTGVAADAMTSGLGAWNLSSALRSGGGAVGQRPPMLLLPQASDFEDSAAGHACDSRESRAAEQGQRSTAGLFTSPSMGALQRMATGMAMPSSPRGMPWRPTAAGTGYEQVSDFATASSAAGTPEVAAATAAMEMLEAAMPPPLWTPPAQGRTLGQLLSELPPASCFTAAVAVGRTRRVVMFRGLRVRVGIHTGVSSAAEMQYNAASARIVYGGPCVAMCKAIADYANGGQIFLSSAAKEQLDEAVHRHNGGKPPGILILRLGVYVKDAAPPVAAVAPPSATAGLLGQCTPRRMLSRLPPSSNNITALAGGGFAVGGIGGNSMLLHRAQTAGGAGSAVAAVLASADGHSASAGVSRQTTFADGGGGGILLVGPASAVRHSSGLQGAVPGGLSSAQLAAPASAAASAAAAAHGGPATIPASLLLPASSSGTAAPQQQQQKPRGGMPKARSLMQLQQLAEPVSSGSRRRALGGDSGVAAGPSASPPKETAVFWLTSSSLSQRLALVSRPRVPKDHSPLQDVYDAPVGRLSYVVVQVPAATALMAWDAEVAGVALRLLQETARSLMRKFTCGAYLSCSQPGELTAAFGSAAAAVRWAEGLRKELLRAPWSEALLAHELCEAVEVRESDYSMACSDDFFAAEEESTMGDTDLDAQQRGQTPPRGFANGRSRSGAPSAVSASDMRRRVSISSASVGVMGNLSRHQLRSREAADGGASSRRGHGATSQGIRGDATVASITAAGGLAAWISSRLDKAAGLGAGASPPASPLALGSSPRRRHVTTAGILAPTAASAVGGGTCSPPSTPRASAAEAPSIAASLGAAAAFASSGTNVGGASLAAGLPPAAQEASTSATLMGSFMHVPSRLGLMHRPAMTPPALSPLPPPATAAGTAAAPAAPSVTGGSTSASTIGLLPPQSAHVLSRAALAAPCARGSHAPCSDSAPRTSMCASPCNGGAPVRPEASSAPDAAAGVDMAAEAADAGALMHLKATPLDPQEGCVSLTAPAGLSASGYAHEGRPLEASAHGRSAASNTTSPHDLTTTSPRCSAQLAAPPTTASASTPTSQHLLVSGCNGIPGFTTNATTSPVVKPEPAACVGRGMSTMAAAVAEYMEARRSQARSGAGNSMGAAAAAAGQNSSTCGRNSLSSALDSLQAGDLHVASLEPTSADEPPTAAWSSVSGAGMGPGPRGLSEGSVPGGRTLSSVPAELQFKLAPQRPFGQLAPQPSAPKPVPGQVEPQVAARHPAAAHPMAAQPACVTGPAQRLSRGSGDHEQARLDVAMARPGAAAVPRSPSLSVLDPTNSSGAANCASVRTAPRLQPSSVRTGGSPLPLNGTPSPRGEQQPQSPLSPLSPRSPPGNALPQTQPQTPSQRQQQHARPPLPHLHHQLRLGTLTSLEAELRQGGASGVYSISGAQQGAANGTNAHRGKGTDALEPIAEPMPASAFDAAAGTATNSTAVAVPGVPKVSPRTTVVPEGRAYANQLASLEEILPQRLDPRGLPEDWPPEQQQNATREDQADAGTRCDDTVVDADGRARHLLLRGLRIRVGIATGRPTWSAADHTHELSYSGKPVRLAQRLAGAVAACGQVVCCAVTCQEALATQQYELLQQQQLAAVVTQRGSNGNGVRPSVDRSLSAQPSSIAEETQERGAAAGAAGVVADGSTALAGAGAGGASAGDSAPMLMAFMPVMEGNAPAYLGGRIRDKKKRWKQVVFVVSLFPPDAPPPSLAAVAAVNRPRLPSLAMASASTLVGDRHAGWLMPMSRSPATPAATPRGGGGVSLSGLLPVNPGSARSHASMPLLKLAGAARSGIAAVAAVAVAAGLKQPSQAALVVTVPRTGLPSTTGSFIGRITRGSSVQAGGGYGGSMPLPKFMMPLAQGDAPAAKDESPDAAGAGAERAPDIDGIFVGGAGGDGDGDGDGDPSTRGRVGQQSRGEPWTRPSLPAAAFGGSLAGTQQLPARSTSSNVAGLGPQALAGWPRPAQAATAAGAAPPASMSLGGSHWERRRTYPAVAFRSSDTGSCSAASPLSGVVLGGSASGAAQPSSAAAAVASGLGRFGSLQPSLAPALNEASKPRSRLQQPATYSGDGSGNAATAAHPYNNRSTVSVAGVMSAASRAGAGIGSGGMSGGATAENWRIGPSPLHANAGPQLQIWRPLEASTADPHLTAHSGGSAAAASAGGAGGFAGHGLRADAMIEERTADIMSGALDAVASDLPGRGSSPGAPLPVGPLEITAVEAGEREVASMLITRSAKSVAARAAATAEAAPAGARYAPEGKLV